jgi:uncharacterized membrane protein YhaH (DUF805 family)
MGYAWFLFSFEGRINRAKYWLSGLIIVCWMLFLAALVLATAKNFSAAAPASFGFGIDDIFGLFDPATYRSAIDGFGRGDLTAATLVPKLFYVIGTLLFLWVYAATSIKRLHDRNKSGWWMVAFFAIPGLYDRFEDRLDDSYTAAFLGLVVGVLTLWGFVEMLCLSGISGPNRFGRDPLAPRETTAHAAPRWDQQSELEFVPHSASLSPRPHVKRGHD